MLLKLGGSVITRKNGPARLRPKVLERLAGEIRDGQTVTVRAADGALELAVGGKADPPERDPPEPT